LTAFTVHAQTYDVSRQFDTVNNPAGTGGWSYGSEPSVGGTFTLLSFQYTDNYGDQGWAGDSTLYPDVEKNTSGHDIDFGGGNVGPANAVTMAASTASALASVVRWTVPVAGVYTVDVSFTNFWNNLGNPDVFVLHNNV